MARSYKLDTFFFRIYCKPKIFVQYKSKKNFLLVDDYLQVLQPDFIRYYLASKLSSGVDDLDMDLNDFQKKVNTDLIGKFINIASRSQGFLKKDSNMLSEVLDNEIIDEFINEKDNIFNLFTAREYSKALKEIMLLADKANQYIDLSKPPSIGIFTPLI